MKEVANRDAQFKNIARLIDEYKATGNPILSMDTKKTEQIGNFYRDGYLYTLEELEVYDHDFLSFSEGKIIPHGLYDMTQNIGYLHLGTSHDTTEFACDCIRSWWYNYGKFDYSEATSMSKVVFEVVAFSLENVIVFVFNFPAGASIAHNGFDVVFPYFKIGDESVFVNDFAGSFVSDGQFSPVGKQGIFAAVQRQVIGVVIGVDFSVFSIPNPLLIRPQSPLSG